MTRFALIVALATGCTTFSSSSPNADEPAAWAPSTTGDRTTEAPATAPQLTSVDYFEAGDRSSVDAPPQDAIALDLSEEWVPLALRGTPSGEAPSYRTDYLAAAKDASSSQAVYGIMPALSVVRARLEQSDRHECHDRLRDGSLAEVSGSFIGWRSHRDAQRGRRETVERLRPRLEQLMAQPDGDDQGKSGEETAQEIEGIRERLAEIEPKVFAIREAQSHLRCDGLLAEGAEDAVIDGPTQAALEQFQARNGLLPTQRLDPDTRDAMRQDSRELDFLVLLRILRERVSESAGILADGTATAESGKVLGYYLDGAKLRTRPNEHDVAGAAPDRLSKATEEVARALGWTDPAEALEHLRALADNPPRGPVAVRVSELPQGPNEPLDLRVEIDRGDVYYDFPYTNDGRRRAQPMDELPSVTIYAKRADGTEEAIVRWPTTIGMWAQEQQGQRVGLRYEESPVGERVWRDLIVAPRWLPPRGIPDQSLMVREEGEWQADYETVGPGPSSAYGLVMLVHHLMREPETEGGEPRFLDQGIRTHGTGNLRSIVEEHQGSHGCHRMFNTNVMRLSGFLLRHRTHVHHGEVEVQYNRRLRDGGRTAQLNLDSRGYRIELDPPVPVNVLEGEIHGRQTAIDGLRPLPAQLRARAAAQSESD